MADQRHVAVLGLGRFGTAVALELTRLGYEVLAVDASERIVQSIVDDVTHAAQADVADREALEQLGLGDFDTVIVGTSSNLSVSILVTVLLKQLGVRRIVAKATDELHGSILEQVGADRVVYPEREAGHRVAHSFAAPGVEGYLDVAPDYGFARLSVSEASYGQPLSSLELVARYDVTPVALCRDGKVTLNPEGSLTIEPGDELVVAGRDEDLARLPSFRERLGRLDTRSLRRPSPPA